MAYGRSNHRAIRISAGFIPLIRFAILFAFIAVLVVGGLQTWKAASLWVPSAFCSSSSSACSGPSPPSAARSTTPARHGLERSRCRAAACTDHCGEWAEAAPQKGCGGRLELQNLSFAYPGRQPVIEALNLEIAQGETLGLVGSTGSGKSTLVKLPFGSTTPALERQPRWVDLRELNQQDLRSAIGLVSQEPLFHGTVADNIRYGSFLASDASVAAAARQAEADGFIQALPDGYNTVVGDGVSPQRRPAATDCTWLEPF